MIETINCPICYDCIEEKNKVTTHCNHTFHFDCLLKVKDTRCPLCRTICKNEHSIDMNTITRLYNNLFTQHELIMFLKAKVITTAMSYWFLSLFIALILYVFNLMIYISYISDGVKAVVPLTIKNLYVTIMITISVFIWGFIGHKLSHRYTHQIHIF